MQNWNKMNSGKCFLARFKRLLDVGCDKQHHAVIKAQSKHNDHNIYLTHWPDWLNPRYKKGLSFWHHPFFIYFLSRCYIFPLKLTLISHPNASLQLPQKHLTGLRRKFGSGWLLIWQWRMLSHIRHLIGFGRMSIIAIIIIAIIITIIITNVGQHHHHHHSHDNHDKGLWDWNGTGKGRWRLGDGWKAAEVDILIIMMTKTNAYWILMMMRIKVVRRESDARVEKKVKLEDILEIEKRWGG